MKIKRVISCLLVAVFSMSLLLVQESAQAKIGTVQKILPSELHVEGRYIYNDCLLYTSPSPRDYAATRIPSSA